MKRLDALILVLVSFLVIGSVGLISFGDATTRQIALALAVAILPASVAILLPGLRLALLAGAPVTGLQGFWANAASVCLFLVLPGRLSEGAKPLILHMEAGLPFAKGLTATALERMLDIAAVLCLAGLLFLSGAYSSTSAGGIEITNLLIVLFVCLVSVGLLIWRGPRLFARSQSRLAKAVRQMVVDSLVVIHRLRGFAMISRLTLITAGIWLSSYLIAFAILEIAGNVSVSPWDALLVFLAGTIGYVVAIAPGGIGTFEAATVLALNSLGYSVSEALFLAVLLRFANMAPAIVSGALYLRLRGLKFRSLIDRVRNRACGPSTEKPKP
ncbi:MAG: lysylphosphatidylglycerol synthase transmembrane domain-containing protein [Silicimonas sp.]|jgi:uncharacterized membrane protein YbhN (UPF0104 family)|uniref:lysylphosphatidylglycerol synthase transmembrane domain-containing protein n=1 Tax=Roseitalea porphyridii TaxID=1852022 RepID=UPI0032ECDEC2